MSQVSVIIPSFNRTHTIARALDSVLAQTTPVKEIIVVDDGSTDNTLEFLASNYPQVTVISQENRGVSAARNVGIKTASGDWIALLDSDDEWLPDKLEVQLQVLQSQSGMRLCHSDEIWIRNGHRVNPMHKHEKSGGWIYKKCLRLCAISPSSALMHRSLFDEYGLFDELLPACEDYDMWLRICSRMPVVYVDEKLIVKYGGHDDQLSRRYWGMDRFRVQALLKMLEAGTLKCEERNPTVEMLINKVRILINGARKRGNSEMVSHHQAILDNYEGASSGNIVCREWAV